MPDKVVIRLINSRSPKPIEDTPPEPIVVYHWHRIVPALILAALLIVGLATGVRHVLRQPDSGPAVAQVAGPDGKPDANPAGAAPLPAAPAARPAQDIQARGFESARPANGSPHPANGHVETATDAGANASQPGRVAIRSQNIRRARLTSNVVNGEPVDELGGTIPMNAKGLLKVFLQTETAGLKGRVLFHDWYWKDKLIAHARVPVTRDVQNSATSKFIDRIMTGPWQVKVIDERKKVYAEVSFDVR